MGFIPQTTCRRCQRQYSVLRGRCPHCGTRRTDEGGHTQRTTGEVQRSAQSKNPNAKWQMIFGAILLAAVIIAVIALVSISLTPKPEAATTPTPDMEATPTPPPTPTPTPTPEPTPTVESITVSFLGSELTDFTMRLTDGPLQLTATVYPVSENAVVRWRSGDTSVITVTDEGQVTAVGSGSTVLVVECGAIAKEFKVRVP